MIFFVTYELKKKNSEFINNYRVCALFKADHKKKVADYNKTNWTYSK